MDTVVLAALILAFAVWVTVHVALAIGLVRRSPRWRGPLALVCPPLAPYWGMETGMKRRSGVWLLALCVYIVARIAAEF